MPGGTSHTIKRATSPGGPFTVIEPGILGASYAASPADGITYSYAVMGSNSCGDSATSTSASTTLYSDYQQWKLSSGLAMGRESEQGQGPSCIPCLGI